MGSRFARHACTFFVLHTHVVVKKLTFLVHIIETFSRLVVVVVVLYVLIATLQVH